MAVSGSFISTGQSAPFAAAPTRDFNITVSGGVAVVQVERSFDTGVTWFVVLSDSLRTALPESFTLSEPEFGVLYRLNCTAWTSGTVTYRLSQ